MGTLKLSPGDVIKVLCGQAGYPKYHLFLGKNQFDVSMFLFLNSENGFVGDLILSCSEVPFLPPSATGETVVSFSMMPRFTDEKLQALSAVYCGKVDSLVGAKIVAHAPTIKTLARTEKQILLTGAALM